MAFTKRDQWEQVALTKKAWEALRKWLSSHRERIERASFYEVQNNLNACQTRAELPLSLKNKGWTHIKGVTAKLDDNTLLEGLKLAKIQTADWEQILEEIC